MLSERQDGCMSKQIVFFVVEGTSDEAALGTLLKKLYGSKEVHVHIVHGDLTSREGHNANNILTKVNDEVKAYLRNNHLNRSHLREIIHLVDTDGVFVDDDLVVVDPSAKIIFYTEENMHTHNKSNTEARNRQKSDNLDRLIATKSIAGTPYRIFYMSCNLDHVLHNKLNSTDEEKEDDAFAFSERFKDRLPDFMDFLSNSDFSVKGTYRESWKYIKQGKHSLERHTNLGLCFESVEPEITS